MNEEDIDNSVSPEDEEEFYQWSVYNNVVDLIFQHGYNEVMINILESLVKRLGIQRP